MALKKLTKDATMNEMPAVAPWGNRGGVNRTRAQQMKNNPTNSALAKWSIIRDRYNVEDLDDRITRTQVIEIIHEQGFSAERFGWTSTAADVIEIFDREFGDRDSYDTVSIFHWLGY